MKIRLVVVTALMLGGLSAAGDSLYACGEKFLMRGRGTRYQRATPMRKPASILVYANPALNLPKSLANVPVDTTLRRAGYKPTTVTSAGELAGALGRGGWDLVVVDLADSSVVTQAPKVQPTVVLPVVLNPTSQEFAAARKRHPHLLKAPVKSRTFLDAVDEALADRSSDEKSRQ
jgi:hypothetical protein